MLKIILTTFTLLLNFSVSANSTDFIGKLYSVVKCPVYSGYRDLVSVQLNMTGNNQFQLVTVNKNKQSQITTGGYKEVYCGDISSNFSVNSNSWSYLSDYSYAGCNGTPYSSRYSMNFNTENNGQSATLTIYDNSLKPETTTCELVRE